MTPSHLILSDFERGPIREIPMILNHYCIFLYYITTIFLLYIMYYYHDILSLNTFIFPSTYPLRYPNRALMT